MIGRWKRWITIVCLFLFLATFSLSVNSLHPVIQDFREVIEEDPVLFRLFTQMFDQIPSTPEYEMDPAGNPQVKDYNHMLQLMNDILTQAPEFNQTGLVGFPINAILDWPMGTPAGTEAFLNEKVNLQLKKILNQIPLQLQPSHLTSEPLKMLLLPPI
jgi:phosphatidylserine decarboxylase